MVVPAPKCLFCEYFIGYPIEPGAKARCSKMKDGIDVEIYLYSKECKKFRKSKLMKKRMKEEDERQRRL